MKTGQESTEGRCVMRSTFLGLICILMSAGTVLAEGDKCCFTNQAFSGVCEQTPAKDETCQSILEYLNAPNSAGKAYCGGTSIRGGWQLAACKAEPKGQSADAREQTPRTRMGVGASQSEAAR